MEEGGGGGRCCTVVQFVSWQRSPVNMRRQWLSGVKTTHMEEEKDPLRYAGKDVSTHRLCSR